jgi:membrane peptidoglycan carboxypeptidase
MRDGVSPPYRESPVTGIRVRGADGRVIFDATAETRVFRRFEEIPALVLNTLLFIENRRISAPGGPRANPAVDWQRSAKALLLYTGRKIGLDLPLEGGSTLAVQLEKFRHSPGGHTASPADKLRQMLGASLTAYQSGPQTLAARRQIVLDYLNTMPLSAVPGFGEIHGLGEGLRGWFGMDLDAVRATLEQPESTPAKARAYRHVLALLYAVRAPTYYLVRNRHRLEMRIDAYAERLHSARIIDSRLLALTRAAPLEFSAPPAAPDPAFVERKAVNAIRFELAKLLPVQDLSDLDRLDLRVDSTIDGALQQQVTALLRQLTSADFIARNGLTGPHLLGRGDPRGVIYSFLLLESRREGNLVRVNTDTLDAPFEVNDGMKLELGSTAKLRTLAHYLGVTLELHRQLSPLDASALDRQLESARDPLTLWAAATLRAQPGLDLASFLRQSLERRYSASPAELFFTGGGVHRFRNFEPEENGQVMSVREALVHSTNLVFIRLMRDLVRFHEARLPYDAHAVLTRSDISARRELLEEIADEESRRSLARAYHRYRDLGEPEILQRLLGERAHSTRELAIVFRAWHAGDTAAGDRATAIDTNALASWLAAYAHEPDGAGLRRLEHAYGSPRLTLADFAYLLRVDPLELWCAGQLARDPQLSWDELLARSAPARQIASAWLFRTRSRNAQDLRLRIRIERDAFARMTPYWRKLGFPFDTLVPSYATAIGSSADRPLALAELMGIILNDGRRLPTLDIRRLSFATATPYETVFEHTPVAAEQVMHPAVARLLREVLAEVVERGTARRLQHVFVAPDGQSLPMGGKTGTGDNRSETFARGGGVVFSHAVNRTASFVFYLGGRWFAVITASVVGPEAAHYSFTSSLPLAVLKLLAPTLTALTSPEFSQKGMHRTLSE